MDVKNSIKISKIHSIEWGGATWNSISKSIRNRYDNAEGDKFNYAASAEIPWADFMTMIIESLKKNQFEEQEIKKITNQILEIKNN